TSKAGTFNVEIINIQGQVVYQKQITQDGYYRETIDISHNAKGIYYVRIMDSKEAKVSKLIIQ
ncbi:MAG TPA: T9SS type A sorting domain-containing protein, partial [Bacteroidales bacterium]|nr:T9SS type A sorting domain-containing protein [Bacteroidales bacterium]